jgi:hypothetical protein
MLPEDIAAGHDQTFAAADAAWVAWVLANEDGTIRDFLAAVEEVRPDSRVFFRGYYHGVRERLDLPTISPLHQTVLRPARSAADTVGARLDRLGLHDAFARQFINGMIAALCADHPPAS